MLRRRFVSHKDAVVSFDYNNYLTIEALEDGVSILFTQNIKYGINGIGWETLKVGEYITINYGQTISFKGNLMPSNDAGIGTFTISGGCNLKGNCLSLLFGDTAANNLDLTGMDYGFSSLFYGCDTIKNITSDFLPATTLANGCYSYMFNGCTSLTTAPELPATTLVSNCYERMLEHCSKLNYIKMLATDITAVNCLLFWVCGVASTGTFVKSKDATWDVVGNSGVPSGWTVITDDQEGGGEITFYVNGIECKAIDGMTFAQWIFSDYVNENAIAEWIGPSGQPVREFYQLYGDTEVWYNYGFGYTPRIHTSDVIISGVNYTKVSPK